MATPEKVEPIGTAHNPLDDLFNQEIRTLVEQKGVYLGGAVEEFKNDGETVKYGFIQLLHPARDKSRKLAIKDIKVREDNYGMIEIMNKTKVFQTLLLQLEVREFGGKTSYYLTQDQPKLKAD